MDNFLRPQQVLLEIEAFFFLVQETFHQLDSQMIEQSSIFIKKNQCWMPSPDWPGDANSITW